MLRVQSLRKAFSSVVAVDGVSLSVKPGEILGLLGPNGAGKTTTIRLILNILQPDSGEITFNGKPFTPEIRNAVGYLPEERGLYRKNKLLNCILYFASLKGMPASIAKLRAMQWLGKFRLHSYADKKVEELSKGNQQKVQFIIAVLHDPQYVILDEPFSGLDPVNQIVLKDELMKLREAGKAVIFSTHLMEQAEKLCDRICLINKGKVVLEGELNEVKRKHGDNSVHIEFSGDGSFLSGMSIFKNVLLYQNSAELHLLDGEKPSEILRLLAGRLDIVKFEVREPSLESIFLEKVGVSSHAAPVGIGRG
jgi:ABC-2 type transport system ATP-binding protein